MVLYLSDFEELPIVLNTLGKGDDYKIVLARKETIFDENEEILISLDLSELKLDYIPDKIFETFAHLKVLNLSHNEIVNISKNTFSGLNELEYLDLYVNKIS